MYILGLTTMGEAAATLIKDGEIVAAAEEERFSRIKHHIGFPFHAIQYCLNEANISIHEVDHVGLYWKPWVVGRRILHTLSCLPQSYSLFKVRAKRGTEQVKGSYLPMFWMKRLIQQQFGEGRFAFHYLDHHLCHAASAFFVSPFEKAAILTIDGVGESTTTMLARGEGTNIQVLKQIKLPHSIGQFYSAITNFLGFDMIQGDEYKVMGLAAYGEPEFYDFLMKHVVRMNGDGTFHIDIGYLDHQLARNQIYTEKIKSIFGPNRKPDEEITRRHQNIAASAQKVLEEVVLRLLDHLYHLTGETSLCMAGGVALNSVMNGRIVRELPFKEIFIQPAAHDAGCSLGAAYYIYHTLLNHPRTFVMNHAYLGPGFTEEACALALESKNLNYHTLAREELARNVAKLLSEGHLVGWFQGRMEWGPRALGNRSLLADPRDAQIKEAINKKVKLREPFRPFAPSILEEASHTFLGKAYEAPFMLLVFPVPEEQKGVIPAVIHVDGTARPQTVSRQVNPLYWSLIKEFEKLTGVPVLLNTSFNIQEPIVCTPDDAIESFLKSDIDYLALENHLVKNPKL